MLPNNLSSLQFYYYDTCMIKNIHEIDHEILVLFFLSFSFAFQLLSLFSSFRSWSRWASNVLLLGDLIPRGFHRSTPSKDYDEEREHVTQLVWVGTREN